VVTATLRIVYVLEKAPLQSCREKRKMRSALQLAAKLDKRARL